MVIALKCCEFWSGHNPIWDYSDIPWNILSKHHTILLFLEESVYIYPSASCCKAFLAFHQPNVSVLCEWIAFAFCLFWNRYVDTPYLVSYHRNGVWFPLLIHRCSLWGNHVASSAIVSHSAVFKEFLLIVEHDSWKKRKSWYNYRKCKWSGVTYFEIVSKTQQFFLCNFCLVNSLHQFWNL